MFNEAGLDTFIQLINVFIANILKWQHAALTSRLLVSYCQESEMRFDRQFSYERSAGFISDL